jgi:hypothetical protein
MEMLFNSNSSVIQLWNPITLRNHEDGGDMFSKTLVLTRVTWHKASEDIYPVTLSVGRAVDSKGMQSI